VAVVGYLSSILSELIGELYGKKLDPRTKAPETD